MNKIELPDDESEAFKIVDAMHEKYGWAVRVLTRHDAETAYDGSEAEAPLTDDEWAALSRSRDWRNLGDVEAEDWELLHAIVYDSCGRPCERATFCQDCNTVHSFEDECAAVSR